jgi:hypothetical protein
VIEDVRDAARDQVAIDRELEQICWQSGYAAGREQAIREVVAWLKDHESEDWTLWDAAHELEHGALDSAVDEPPQPHPEASAEVPPGLIALLPGVTHEQEAGATAAGYAYWLGSPPAPEDVADEHPRQDAPDKGEHGL